MILTPSQRHAVESESEQVLCIAGAGSGKTRVLVERIAHLINHRGVMPSQIMCLTFTRRAAGEMKERIRQTVHADLSTMMFGTFHSVALRILTLHGRKIGYENPTVVNEADADLLLTIVCEDLGYVHGRKWRNGLSMAQVRQAREDFYTSGEEPSGEHERIIVREYGSRLYAMQLLDFGRILIECRRLFVECPAVIDAYRAIIKHVLVDELQDADTVQYDMHEWFAPPASFFAVGDTRQSIYGFRGARPGLMRDRHPQAEIIDLRENFRSGLAVVGAANRLIAHNGENLPPMICATGCAGESRTMTGRSADIAAGVQQIYSDGFAWSDIAVLARRHSTLERISDMLREINVPHHYVGTGMDICASDNFLTLLAGLRLCVNEKDSMAKLRWDRGFYAMNGHRNSMIDAVREAIRGGDRDVIPTDVAPVAVELCGGNCAEAAWWQRHCPDTRVDDALRWFSVMDAQDDLPSGNVVTLATIHASKGLEWPAVIIANCMEGELPGSRALRETGGLEEERRCAYVAVTRARELIVLHWRMPADQAQDRRIQEPSRFIKECGL